MSTNSISFLFGSSTSSNGFNLYSTLGDYSSLRTGSYQKLLRSYYAQQNTNSQASTSTNNKVDSVEKKSLLEAKSSADSLVKASSNLLSGKVFEKTDFTVKDAETGTTSVTKDYDRDAIYKAVKTFVDSYNDTLDTASEVDTAGVLQKTLFMTNQTGAYHKSFSKVGITIGSDNKLSIDEATMKKSDINDLKTLFTGFNSFASKTMQKASAISSEATWSAGFKTYTSSGNYNLSSLYSRINTTI